MEKFIPKKGSKAESKLTEYSSMKRWFLDNGACLCMEPGKCVLSIGIDDRVRLGATVARCKELRIRMQNSKGRGEAKYGLQNLFAYCREEYIPEQDVITTD